MHVHEPPEGLVPPKARTCYYEWPPRVPSCSLRKSINSVCHHVGSSCQQALMHPPSNALEFKRQWCGCYIRLQVSHLQTAAHSQYLRCLVQGGGLLYVSGICVTKTWESTHVGKIVVREDTSKLNGQWALRC